MNPMKTYRQIRQSLTEVGADREEDKNFKLGPEKMSPVPSDEDEYDELDDTEEDEHQVIDAVRPLYVRDKLGHYTTSDSWSSSGTMAQMTQQAATKNLQSEYVPEDGESLDEEENIDELSKKTLAHYTKRAAKDLGDTEFNRGAAAATGMAKSSQLKRTRRNRSVGIGRAVNRLAKEETIEENAMDTLKKVVARNTAETVRLADGSRMKVDLTTASALLGVHGALNIHNQKKMADILNSNKAGFAKMSKFAFKQFGSRSGKVGTPNLPVGEALSPENLRQREYSRPRKSGNLGSPIEKKGVQAPDPRRSKEGGDSYTRRDPHIGARGVKKVRGASRPQTSEYTPDHGETFAETEKVVPGGRYTNKEQKAAAERAKANRAKRAAARAATEEVEMNINELSPELKKRYTKKAHAHQDSLRWQEVGVNVAANKEYRAATDNTGDYAKAATKEREVKAKYGAKMKKLAVKWRAREKGIARASEEYIYTQEEWDSLSESEKGDILMRQAVAKRIKKNRELKAQKREVARGKRKSGKTSDKMYDYMIDKEEGKDQKTEKNPPQKYQHS
jgi:hypothetical protein